MFFQLFKNNKKIDLKRWSKSLKNSDKSKESCKEVKKR